jgi:multidrug efflux pump subunit AcrB
MGRIRAGAFATLVTPREEEPQIDVTMADVLVAFPGALGQGCRESSPVPAEQVLSRMHGVEHVYSMSRSGMAVITVQFDVGVKYNDAVLRLYDTVHSHRDWLPPNLGVQEPVIKPRGIDDVPIVALTFWTKDPSARPSICSRWRAPSRSNSSASRARATCRRIGGPDHVIRVLMDSRADERLRRHAAGHRRRTQGVECPAIVGQPDRRQPRGAGADRHLPRIGRRREATGRRRARQTRASASRCS